MYNFDVFISYKQEAANNDRIKNLYEALSSDQLKVWWDKKLLTDTNLYDQLVAGIQNSKTILCCLTKGYLTSFNCAGEINLAFTTKKRIIIIMFERIEIK